MESIFNTDTIHYIPTLIVALSTVAIVSMDLGVPYNKKEQKIYTNPFFQIVVAFSVASLLLKNIKLALLIVFIWGYLKHSDNSLQFSN